MTGATTISASGKSSGSGFERDSQGVKYANILRGTEKLLSSQSLRRNEIVSALVAAAFLLLAALSRWPYVFYILLRIAVCAIGLYLAHTAYITKRMFWVWVFGAIAVTFNPILPLRMHRSDWSTLNVISATIFGAWVITSVLQSRKEFR
jgi:hypothetical protein